MILTIVLVVAYFFFMTDFGKHLFGVLVTNLFYAVFLIINPISLICGLGVYFIIKGMTG